MKALNCHIPFRPLSSLKDLFKEWYRINSKYCADHEDALYSYTERATTGSLAAAIWLSGEYAVEEFAATKEDAKDRWEGRVDLWFEWYDTDYVAEAKQLWVQLSPRTQSPVIRIEDALKEALTDVGKSRREGSRRLGIVFVVPFIEKRDEAHRTSVLSSFMKHVYDVDYDFMCSVFPPSARDVRGWQERLFPGVVMIGRVPKRW